MQDNDNDYMIIAEKDGTSERVSLAEFLRKNPSFTRAHILLAIRTGRRYRTYYFDEAL